MMSSTTLPLGILQPLTDVIQAHEGLRWYQIARDTPPAYDDSLSIVEMISWPSIGFLPLSDSFPLHSRVFYIIITWLPRTHPIVSHCVFCIPSVLIHTSIANRILPAFIITHCTSTAHSACCTLFTSTSMICCFLGEARHDRSRRLGLR